MLFVSLKSLHGPRLMAHAWEQHLSYLSVGKWCAHAHLLQLQQLQLASPTNAVVIGVQQNGLYFSMHNHQHFLCHLSCKHAIDTGSAEQEGWLDSLVSSKKTRKNIESHHDEKPDMKVMQRLNNFSQRTTSEIMSSNYPRWRTDSEEVIITAKAEIEQMIRNECNINVHTSVCNKWRYAGNTKHNSQTTVATTPAQHLETCFEMEAISQSSTEGTLASSSPQNLPNTFNILPTD